MYAAQSEALDMMMSMCFLVLLVFLRRYERPVLITGNPFGTYTPSHSNPRCGYHYVPTNTEFSIGFNILSLFTPLRF